MNGSRQLLLWSPRILGIAVSLFVGAFALDAIGDGIGAFLLHATPALLLLLVVAVSWRWPWIGGAVFITLGVAYAATTLRRLDWVLVISGPLILVGILFLLSWRQRQRLHSPSLFPRT